MSLQLLCSFDTVNNVYVSGPTKDTAQAEFANIPAGDCFVEVSAPGYKTMRERAIAIQATSSVPQYLYVYLHSTWGIRQQCESARFDEGAEGNRRGYGGAAQKSRAPKEADIPLSKLPDTV